MCKHSGGYTAFKYNGKEYDMMNRLNQYDYHAYQYDPRDYQMTRW
ncbi:MAG: hypothetical protein ACK5MK_09350 [Dysgonomonas sp.]